MTSSDVTTGTPSDFTGSLIDHLNLAVPDLPRSVAFYQSALAPLGIVTTMTVPAGEGLPAMHGFGWEHKPFFWLIADGAVGTNTHLAFTAPDRVSVDAFYEAALAAGATSRIPPDIQEYHPDYYGAFVDDPDGINLEAVCHHPARPGRGRSAAAGR